MNVIAPSDKGVHSGVDANSLASLFASGNLLELLVAVRGSSLSGEEKMELRDLILEFSQLEDKTKKENIQQDIIDRILLHRKEFTFLLPKSKEQPIASVSTAVNDEKRSPSKKTLVNNLRATPNFNVPKPKVAKAPIPATNQPIKPDGSAPSTQNQKTPSSNLEEKASTDSVDAVSPNPNYVDPLVRIKEIKSFVNSKVGNPVNLMDTDKEVGREYMTALLEAMKKSTGGSSAGGLVPAMERLERAYSAVQQLLDNDSGKPNELPDIPEVKTDPIPPIEKPVETVESKQPVKVNETPKAEAKLEQPVIPKAVPVVQPVTAPKLKSVSETVANNVQKPEAKKQSSIAPVKTVSEPKEEKGLYHAPENDAVTTTGSPVREQTALQRLTTRFKSGQDTSAEQKNENVEPKTEQPVVEEKPKVISEPPAAPPQPKPQADVTPPVTARPVKSVASAESLPEMAKKEADSKKDLGDDLMVHEVTAGLEQLLSEWKIFKSSGWLGTGPSGIEHPMYKQLGPMPMASVIAGRFEGVTNEVKHSITDYMNGWRYEQGIVHEMGETFEHYLRRVVLHILKMQRGQRKNSAS